MIVPSATLAPSFQLQPCPWWPFSNIHSSHGIMVPYCFPSPHNHRLSHILPPSSISQTPQPSPKTNKTKRNQAQNLHDQPPDAPPFHYSADNSTPRPHWPPPTSSPPAGSQSDTHRGYLLGDGRGVWGLLTRTPLASFLPSSQHHISSRHHLLRRAKTGQARERRVKGEEGNHTACPRLKG
jgi:hypothetical protein